MSREHRRVAALYVDTASGPYPSVVGVECWGRASKTGSQIDWLAQPDRDATQYAGPMPIVAHPPCGPWGLFAWNYKGGEGDREAGLIAVEQVERWGGVLEHPAKSQLWKAAGLPRPQDPPKLMPDGRLGLTVQVNQCDWGHKAQKPTWLYVVGAPELPPMPEPREATHVFVLLASSTKPELPKRERHLTPPLFARWLVELAASCWRAVPGMEVRVAHGEPSPCWTWDGCAFTGRIVDEVGDSVDVVTPSGDVEPFDREMLCPVF